MKTLKTLLIITLAAFSFACNKNANQDADAIQGEEEVAGPGEPFSCFKVDGEQELVCVEGVNEVDTDVNGDGEEDNFRCVDGDEDGDGTPDGLDADDDNDGVDDADDNDLDNDGVDDNDDDDLDNDGLEDRDDDDIDNDGLDDRDDDDLDNDGVDDRDECEND